MKGKKSSKYYGVSWNRRSLNWVARIYIGGKGVHVGTFEDEDKAGKMVDVCLIKHFKEPRNFKWKKSARKND